MYQLKLVCTTAIGKFIKYIIQLWTKLDEIDTLKNIYFFHQKHGKKIPFFKGERVCHSAVQISTVIYTQNDTSFSTQIQIILQPEF